MTLTVSAVVGEAEGIRSFELRDPQGACLPAFDAGAHVLVSVALPDGRTAQRPYSLLGDPEDRHRYRIAVHRADTGRGGSRHLHEHVAAGSQLEVAPPRNTFPLHEAPHTILVAGGIGITPVLSMVRTLARHGRSYDVHYAARTRARMAFREELEGLAGARAHFYVTEASPATTAVANLLDGAPPGTRVYVCGPPRLMRAVADTVARADWPADHVHVETFGPQARDDDRPIEVHLARSALTVRVGAAESILDAVLNAGVWTGYECRHGTCATCVTRVLAGTPDHRDSCLSGTLREHHLCLCVSRARSNHLTLDL